MSPKRSAFECANCGKTWWLSQEDATRQKRSDHFFCSGDCSAEFRREIGDDMVQQAIDMRHQGETWTALSKRLGFTPQGIQVRIWKRLHAAGMLRWTVLRSIWSPEKTRDRGWRASWSWIEKKTGIAADGEQAPKQEG